MATLADIADHLDLSVRSVSTLKRAGVFPEAQRAGHDLDAVRVAYIRHLRESAAGRSAAYGTLDLTAERARLAHAQAEKAERENAVADGKFLEVAVFHLMVTSAFSRVRSKLLAVPSKLAPYLVGIETSAKAQGIVKTEIYAALNELAATNVAGISEDGEIIEREPGDTPETDPNPERTAQ